MKGLSIIGLYAFGFLILFSGIVDAKDCCATGTWNCVCGDTVVASCTMGSSLGPCAEGLKIKNAFLDCNGRSIFGYGNFYGNTSLTFSNGTNTTYVINHTGIGVEAFPGYTMEIGNCYISGFQYGVVADDYSGNIAVHDNRITNSTYGIYITDHSVRNKIYRNTIQDNQYGTFNAGDHQYFSDNNFRSNLYYGVYHMGAINNTFWNTIFLSSGVLAYETNDSIKNVWNKSVYIIKDPEYINYCAKTGNSSTLTYCSFIGTMRNYNCTFFTQNLTVINCRNKNGQLLAGLSPSTEFVNLGNNWSDFSLNLGWPHYYYIPGPGNGIDYSPIGAKHFVPPDFDNDGDVDMSDFGFFQICIGMEGLNDEDSCSKADFTKDGSVNQSDFSYFQLCTSGASVPISSECYSAFYGGSMAPLAASTYSLFPDCVNGQTQLCSEQKGVCTQSKQVCTHEVWNGCSLTSIQGYEINETLCDGKDNDCDGVIDEMGNCTITKDSDGDGINDIKDQCPRTEKRVKIDKFGCSNEQFCNSILITKKQDEKTCLTADWKNNEKKNHPGDCGILTEKVGKKNVEYCIARRKGN